MNRRKSRRSTILGNKTNRLIFYNVPLAVSLIVVLYKFLFVPGLIINIVAPPFLLAFVALTVFVNYAILAADTKKKKILAVVGLLFVLLLSFVLLAYMFVSTVYEGTKEAQKLYHECPKPDSILELKRTMNDDDYMREAIKWCCNNYRYDSICEVYTMEKTR